MKPWLWLFIFVIAGQAPESEAAGNTGSPSSMAQAVSAKPEAKKIVTVAFAPLWLLAQIIEVRVDARLGSSWGAAVSAGWGDPEIPYSTPTYRTRYGGELRYYPPNYWGGIAAFDNHGYVGTMAYWEHTRDYLEEGNHIILSPMGGYKFVARHGFTVDYQIGVHFAVVSDGPTSLGQERVRPMAGIYLGWSF